MKVDYQKTFIYKLCCKDINIKDIYVGHTTDYKSRNYSHKNVCNNPNNKEYNRYKYKFIRENGGYENWVMIKIKDYPCNNKREAEKEENRIMIELGATLNSCKSYLSEEEKKKQNKKHYQQNKDIINEKNKKHYQQNKTERLEKQKNYYQQNKTELSKKVICELCGTTVRQDYLKKHQKKDTCIKKSECLILDED